MNYVPIDSQSDSFQTQESPHAFVSNPVVLAYVEVTRIR